MAFSALEISGTFATLLHRIVIRRARTKDVQKPAAAEAVQDELPSPPSPHSAGEPVLEDHNISLEARIAMAETTGNEAELAGLVLMAARTALSRGHTSEATLLLCKSIASAVRSGHALVHAEARLELAELARAAGDLTSACEHWQMARELFHTLKDDGRVAETDATMRHHGCPTDWVLNDF